VDPLARRLSVGPTATDHVMAAGQRGWALVVAVHMKPDQPIGSEIDANGASHPSAVREFSHSRASAYAHLTVAAKAGPEGPGPTLRPVGCAVRARTSEGVSRIDRSPTQTSATTKWLGRTQSVGSFSLLTRSFPVSRGLPNRALSSRSHEDTCRSR